MRCGGIYNLINWKNQTKGWICSTAAHQHLLPATRKNQHQAATNGQAIIIFQALIGTAINKPGAVRPVRTNRWPLPPAVLACSVVCCVVATTAIKHLAVHGRVNHRRPMARPRRNPETPTRTARQVVPFPTIRSFQFEPAGNGHRRPARTCRRRAGGGTGTATPKYTPPLIASSACRSSNPFVLHRSRSGGFRFWPWLAW